MKSESLRLLTAFEDGKYKVTVIIAPGLGDTLDNMSVRVLCNPKAALMLEERARHEDKTLALVISEMLQGQINERSPLFV